MSASLAAAPQNDAAPVDTIGILHSIEDLYGVPNLSGAADPANGNIDALLNASVAPTTTTTVPTTTPTTTATTVLPTTPTTTKTTVPPTTPTTTTTTTNSGSGSGSGVVTKSGSGPTGPSKTVSAPSSALAFTGPGPGVGELGVIGGALILLGLALLILVQVPRRLVIQGALVDQIPFHGYQGGSHITPAPSGPSDLWLIPPRS